MGARPAALLVGAVVAAGAAGVPDALAAGARARAVRAVKQRVIPRGHRAVVLVRCARRRSGGTTRRFACRWRGDRRLSPNVWSRCSGRATVRVGRARARVRARRIGRFRCRGFTRAVDPQLGFNDNSIRAGQLSAERDARLTEAVGAGLHRLTVDWRNIERSPDVYRWTDYDRIYAAMLSRGIRPVLIVAFAPLWARPFGALCLGESLCRGPPKPAAYPALRRFAGLLARRYPRAAAIEAWNEPNESAFWQPSPDPRGYVAVLREVWLGVKEAVPSMPVVSGGLSGRSIARPGQSITVRDFTRAIYAYGGSGSFDALGVHAYPSDATLGQVRLTLDETRAVAASFGDAGRPIWVTETGYTTSGNTPYSVSPAMQGDGTIAIYRYLKAQPDVRAVIFHQLIDPPLGVATNPDSGFGLLRADGSAKPAYCRLVAELRTGVACP